MPLVALMEQQSAVLQACGISAIYAKDSNSLNVALHGNYSHIFLTPELLLSEGIRVLETISTTKRQSFSHIFIDETHCVLKW